MIPVVCPLYVPHADILSWDLAFRYPPQVAILNINSGPGFLARMADADIEWLGKAAKLRSLQTRCLGYVWVDYGKRALGEVARDMRSWQAYAGVTGYFFDCAPNDVWQMGPLLVFGEQYKNTAWETKGRNTSNVMNLGTSPVDPGWGATKFRKTQFVTFEDTAAEYLYRPEPVLPGIHLVHSCPEDRFVETFARAAALGATGLYVTPDTPPNPWDTYYPQGPLAKGEVIRW